MHTEAEKINHQQIYPTRNVTGCPSGTRKMTVNGNMVYINESTIMEMVDMKVDINY